MANQFNVLFISIGADEAIYSPPDTYCIGRKSDCRVIQISQNYTIYDVCCYSKTGTDWRLADADVEEEAQADLWIILSPSGSSGDYVVIARKVWIKNSSSFSLTAYKGHQLFLSQTEGKMLVAPPSGSGVCVRVLGHVEEAGTEIWFEPSKDYLKLA